MGKGLFRPPRVYSREWVGIRFLGPALLAVLLLLPAAAADGVVDSVSPPFETTVTLEANGFVAFAIDLETGALVTAEAAVESGSEVDVYFTGLQEYRSYVDPNATEFRYYPGLSAVATRRYSQSLVSPGGAPATYVLIVDNTALWQDGAVPSGPVTVHVNLHGVPGGVLGTGLTGPAVFTIILLLMFASAAVGHAIGRRHRPRLFPAKAPPPSGSVPPPPPPPDAVQPSP